MKHDRLSILRAQEAARLEQEKADAFYVKAVGRSTQYRDDPTYRDKVLAFEARQTLPTPPKTAACEEIDRIQKETVVPKAEEPKYWVCVKACTDSVFVWWVGAIAEGSLDVLHPGCFLRCDKDGWITHDPQPYSTCPVPAGVGFEAKCRCGTPEPHPSPNSWQLGVPGDRRPSMFDIVAWRPVKS